MLPQRPTFASSHNDSVRAEVVFELYEYYLVATAIAPHLVAGRIWFPLKGSCHHSWLTNAFVGGQSGGSCPCS